MMQLHFPPPSVCILTADNKAGHFGMGVYKQCPNCKTPYHLVAYHLYDSHTQKGFRGPKEAHLLFQKLLWEFCLLVAASIVDVFESGAFLRFRSVKVGDDDAWRAILAEAQNAYEEEEKEAREHPGVSPRPLRDQLQIVLLHFKAVYSVASCEERVKDKFPQSPGENPVSMAKWHAALKFLKERHHQQYKEPIEYEGVQNPDSVIPSWFQPYAMHSVQKVGKIVMEVCWDLAKCSPNPECASMSVKQKAAILEGEKIC